MDEREKSQDKAQANVDDKEQAHELTVKGIMERAAVRAQAQQNSSNDLTLSSEKEQSILTQRKVMDLLMHHQALPNNTSEGLAASIWATKKQGFKDMLSGFQSPTGTTYRVALDLASVLFVSVAAADANRRSLMAQNEAQQKLVAQAEKHRETLEKEFTLNLKRIREENKKTLEQTIRIREELIRSCQPVNNDGMLENIEGNQGAEIIKCQLRLMKAQRDRLERELRDNREKHKADMLKVMEDNRNTERDLERERTRVRLLEKDLRVCEESIMEIGITRPPRQEHENEPKIKVEEPESKRFKKDEALRAKTREDNIKRDDEIAREQENLVREKEKGIREKQNLEREESNLARDTKPARVKKDIQDIATGATPAKITTSSQVFTSAYTQSAHHQRNLGIITKSESSMADAEPSSREHCASNQPGAYQMTKELKQLAVTSWKNLLVSTRDYLPLHVRSAQTHESGIKLLRRAISHFKDNKPPGVQSISWDHDYFRDMQRKYYIPQAFCDPEVYFQNLKQDPCFAYYNRPISVKVYYELLLEDTPGYVKQPKRQPKKYKAPIAHNPGFQRAQASPPRYDNDEALTRWRQGLPDTQGRESSSASNDTTKLSDSQKWAADQAQLRR
jgi:hypothetical protein